jgi:hypothetical protein
MGKIMSNGYEMKTTFWEDFTIADAFGVSAIEDTYNRAFNGWKHDYVYITELSLVLNWKMFQWYEKDDSKYQIYYDLYTKLDAWCMDNLRNSELIYYIDTTD